MNISVTLDEYLNELRTTDKIQSRTGLRTLDSLGNPCYDALGVLAEMSTELVWNEDSQSYQSSGEPHYRKGGLGGHRPDWMSFYTSWIIRGLNDHHNFTFAEIADYLEQKENK